MAEKESRCHCVVPQPGTPFTDGTRVCRICGKVKYGPSGGGLLLDDEGTQALKRDMENQAWKDAIGLASQAANEHARFVAEEESRCTQSERRAFWREVYLAAAAAPPLVLAEPTVPFDLDHIAARPGVFCSETPKLDIQTPADLADVALAEFDKRFK